MGSKGAAFVFSFLVVFPAVANAQWTAARGGPGRTGIRAGAASLAQPQEAWTMNLGGDLSSRSVWVLDSSDPAVLVAAGGRISAKAWDDVLSWESELLRANEILAVIDVDQDGTDDTIVANRNGTSGTLTLLNMDGTIRWIAPPSIGPVVNGVRVEDLDGDGNLDLLVTPYRSGADPGVSAFTLSPTTSAPTLLWHATRDNRDYKAGFYDAIGEFDGTPGLEILSAGHRHLYLHDAATGALEQTSPTIELVPYGRATIRVADTNGDGVDEIFTFSNQGWAAPQNRRHVSAYSWNTGAFAELWSVTLDDPENDRLSFSSESVGDFDNDGMIEVAFSIYDAQSSFWTLQVRDASTGALLTSRPLARLSSVVELDNQKYLATREDGLLEFFQFQRGVNLTRVYATTGLEVATCREQAGQLRMGPSTPSCTLDVNGDDIGGVVLFSRDAEEQVSSVSILHSLVPTIISTHTPNAGNIVGFWKIGNSGPATLALGLSSGEIRPLTNALAVPPPVVSPPYSWNGVFFGATVERTNFARFPLSFNADSGTAENILLIRGDNEAVAIAPSQGATMSGGVTELWSESGVDRINIAGTGSSDNALLFNQRHGIRAVSTADGQQSWQVNGLFDVGDGVYLHHDSVSVSGKTWFHTVDSNSGTYNLTSISNLDGAIESTSSLDSNNSGWRRLTSVRDSLGASTVASGPINQIWTYDPLGTPFVEQTNQSAAMILDIDGGWLQIGRSSFQGVSYDGTVLWDTTVSNSPKTRLGAIVSSDISEQYITSLGNSNQLLSLNTLTGATNWTTLLSGGNVVAELTNAETFFGNVTAVAELSVATGAGVLVGGSDGYLYALDADDGTLVWSLDLGAPVGEIISSDWDGDGDLELCVVTEDGKVRGIDTFTVPAPLQVLDIDPQGTGETDISRLVSTSQLAATWSPVQDALGYEVAVYDMAGNNIRPFSPVGNKTNVVVSELPLVSGNRYRMAIRAQFSGSQYSVDTASDGVTVVFEAPEDVVADDVEPPATVGGCSTGSSNTNGLGFLLLLGSLLVFRVRRLSWR